MMRWLLLPVLLASCAAASDVEPMRGVAVSLDMSGSTCSGTVVARDVILTAAHCFDAGRLTAINGTPANALRMVKDGRDHALVKVDRTFKRWAVRGKAPQEGETVRWIGNPGGMVRVYRNGYVAQVENGVVLIDAPVFGGDSGSGVFNAKGQLVGVVSGAKVIRNIQMTMQLAWLEPMSFTSKQWKEMS